MSSDSGCSDASLAVRCVLRMASLQEASTEMPFWLCALSARGWWSLNWPFSFATSSFNALASRSS
eukprot:5737132-Pyramimonas_sp.AAC.2